MVDDLPAGEHLLFVGGGGHQDSQAVSEASLSRTMRLDRFDQPVGEVAAGGGEDGARAHGRVAHPQAEDLGRDAESPLLGVGLVLWPRFVDEWLQGVAHDLLGQRLGRVLGAHVPAGRRLGDVLRARQQHDRQTPQVGADQPPERQHPLDGGVVVAAGDSEAGEIDAARPVGEKLDKRGRGALTAGLVGQPLAEGDGPGGELSLELGDGELGLGALGADQAQRQHLHGSAAVVEQALVAVADLLDVERLVADPLGDGATAGPDLDVEKSIEDGEHGPVVDAHRSARTDRDIVGGPEVDAVRHEVVGCPKPFEEGEPAGVEEAAAVGGHRQAVVVGPAVDSTEGGEEPVPGGRATLEGVLAVPGRSASKVVAQGQHRVRLGPQRVLGRQQPSLLGEEQEHEAHQHGDRCLVDFGRSDVVEDLPIRGDVVARDGGDEQLHRAADRRAEALGDLDLGVGGALEEPLDGLVGGHGEEPSRAEHRHHAGLEDPLVGEVADAPATRRCGRASRRPHQRPPVVVGHQRQRDPALPAPGLGALDRTGRPGVARRHGVGSPFEVRARRPGEHPESNVAGLLDVEEDCIRP